MRGSNVSLTDILLTSIHALFIVLSFVRILLLVKLFFSERPYLKNMLKPGLPGFRLGTRLSDIPCKTCHFVNDYVILLTIHISEFARIMKE